LSLARIEGEWLVGVCICAIIASIPFHFPSLAPSPPPPPNTMTTTNNDINDNDDDDDEKTTSSSSNNKQAKAAPKAFLILCLSSNLLSHLYIDEVVIG